MAAMAAMAAMAVWWPQQPLCHVQLIFWKSGHVAEWLHGRFITAFSSLFHRFTLKKAAIRPRIVNFLKKLAMAAMAGLPLGYPLPMF